MPRLRESIFTPSVTRFARIAIVTWAMIGVAVVAYLVVRYLLYPIRVLFPPLLLALLIVYLLNPVVSMLERRGIRRGWATLITYLTLLTAVGVGLAYLIPIVVRQVGEFGSSIPELLERAQQGVVDLARELGFDISGRRIFSPFEEEGQFSEFIGRIQSVTLTVIEIVVVLVLGPVIAFYILIDLPRFRQGIAAAIPRRRRPEFQDLMTKLSTAIGGYFRGQLLVAAFVGVASMLGLWLVGLPYWAPIGLIAGLFNLVPLIGPFIGAVPALFIAFTTPASSGPLLHPRPGWPLAIAASVALLLVQQIDNHVVSPNVMGRTVKIHPLTVLLSLLVAGVVLGLWGMLLVIPVVASVKILLIHYWDTRLVWPPDAPVASERSPPDERDEPDARDERDEPVAGEAPMSPEVSASEGEPAPVPVGTSRVADGVDSTGRGDGQEPVEPGRGARSWWSRTLWRMLHRADRTDRTHRAAAPPRG